MRDGLVRFAAENFLIGIGLLMIAVVWVFFTFFIERGRLDEMTLDDDVS
jgi:hypothetical protein